MQKLPIKQMKKKFKKIKETKIILKIISIYVNKKELQRRNLLFCKIVCLQFLLRRNKRCVKFANQKGGERRGGMGGGGVLADFCGEENEIIFILFVLFPPAPPPTLFKRNTFYEHYFVREFVIYRNSIKSCSFSQIIIYSF